MVSYKQWWIMIACCLIGTVKGLTCSCGNIQEGQDVACQCDDVNKIQWRKGNTEITACIGAVCIPNPVTGYTFSTTGSPYKITISTFNLTNCKGYSAQDIDKDEYAYFPYCPVLTMTKPMNNAEIEIPENTTEEFVCEMRSGYPTDTVTWYVDSKTPNNLADDVEITSGSSSSSAQSPTDNREYITTSTLTFSPSRSYTGNRIYCKATSKPEQTPLISERKPLLNILYYSGGPTITEGSSYRVIENTLGQLSCVVTGGNPPPTVTWNCNSGTQTNTPDGDTITHTVTWTAHRDNSDQCTCQSSQTELQTRTASTQITVLYPPSAPTFKINGQTISGDIMLIENSSRQIRCVSTGRPGPTIVWEKPVDSSATSSGQVLSFTRVSKTTDNGTYTCKASNVMDPTDPTGLPTPPETRSSSREIIVLYPSSMLNFYFGSLTGQLISSKTIDVIKEDTFSIGCKSMDGEPEPTIKWNGQSTNNPILTVQQIQESQTGKTCTATNQMLASGSSSTQQGRITDTISFNILIPPTISKCEFYNNKTNSVLTNVNTLMILEGESFTLTCSAAGKPSPNPTWSGPTSSLASWSLPVNDVTRQGKGTYTFSATSVLEPSFQPSKTITANETITIEILYPPVVEQMADISRVQGSSLTLDCPYTEGFPTVTSTQWKRDTDSKTWNNKITIQSIKKSDAGRYTCIATNTMLPSGDTQSTGNDEKQFVLTVLYEASITSFYVDGFEGKAEVTVDEGIPVMFKCSADSLPIATITLKRSSVSLQSETSNSLEYPLSEASCLDAGTFSCAARNLYNTETSMETVRLFVKCLPRSAHTVNQNRTSEKNESFTFTFNAIAYPVPGFMWKKRVDDDWKPLQNDDNTQITSSGLQSNLTITRVRQSDFGQYLLVVTNNVGEMEQSYQLEPYGKPDVPTEFRHVENQATQSTLQLEWKPGFNGGPPQTFYIKYKQSSSHIWSYVDVSDNGELIMRYQLTGLKSDTEYQLIIYSSNIKGNSTELDTVTAKTKGEEDTSNIGPLIGGAVGGGLGVAIIVLVVIFVLRRYRFNKGGSGDKKKFNDRTGGPPNDDDDNSEDIEIIENAAYISAGDVEQARPETHKKPVGSGPGGDIYAQVNKKDKKPVGGATGGDIYAEVKKKDKKPEPKQKPKKGKGKAAVQGDIYENAPGTSNDKVYANADANTYEETQIGKTPAKKNVNKDGLIYADLTFNDQGKGDKKLVIIGDDDRTPYAQVDFTKKADPLPDSDPE